MLFFSMPVTRMTMVQILNLPIAAFSVWIAY